MRCFSSVPPDRNHLAGLSRGVWLEALSNTARPWTTSMGYISGGDRPFPVSRDFVFAPLLGKPGLDGALLCLKALPGDAELESLLPLSRLPCLNLMWEPVCCCCSSLFSDSFMVTILSKYLAWCSCVFNVSSNHFGLLSEGVLPAECRLFVCILFIGYHTWASSSVSFLMQTVIKKEW